MAGLRRRARPPGRRRATRARGHGDAEARRAIAALKAGDYVLAIRSRGSPRAFEAFEALDAGDAVPCSRLESCDPARARLRCARLSRCTPPYEPIDVSALPRGRPTCLGVASSTEGQGPCHDAHVLERGARYIRARRVAHVRRSHRESRACGQPWRARLNSTLRPHPRRAWVTRSRGASRSHDRLRRPVIAISGVRAPC